MHGSKKAQKVDLLKQLVKASAKVTSEQKKALAGLGISLQQFHILKALNELNNEPSSINSLGEFMIDKMSNTSRLVDKLRVKKLLTRVNLKEDKRKVQVQMTKKGLNTYQKAYTYLAKAEKKLITPLTAADKTALIRIMKKLS